MVWLKRRFRAADCVPYQDKLAHLMLAMPARYSEFAMVSIRTDEVSARDYFISLPLDALAVGFDGFERVVETDLPREIDSFHLGNATKLASRFRFRRLSYPAQHPTTVCCGVMPPEPFLF